MLSPGELYLSQLLGDVPPYGRLLDLRHRPEEQRHAGLQERRSGAAGLLERVAGPHAHDLVRAVDDAADQLIDALRLREHERQHAVDVVQRARVAATELLADRPGSSRESGWLF